MKRIGYPLGLALFLLLVMAVLNRQEAAQTMAAQATAVTTPAYLPFVTHLNNPVAPAIGPLYGVDFMSSAEAPADSAQYTNALATGAEWNRWPVYWFSVEQNPDVFTWSATDAALSADIAHGLQTELIFLGTPGFYTTLARTVDGRSNQFGPYSMRAPSAAAPQGLYAPIFSDGTDIPAPGKTINPDNKWARFVTTAVNRYKPGGLLAQANQWPAGVGVTHWEVWNEPDLVWFWDSSVADYARLLKVAYLTTKFSDPNAQVLFAGMANNFQHLTYYDEVLDIFDGDPLATPYHYFHDIFATHSYFYAWRSWYHVWRASNTMHAHGFDKPIWLNETGVPSWDDYPGPVWDAHSGLRASMAEQADYVIQTVFYGVYGGADAVFYFQLYDGCGNQPAGTDFPPHNGELCTSDGHLINNPEFPCAGDANGLFRNPTDAVCFRQHPQPESPRPNFTALRLLTRYLTDVQPLWRLRPGSDDPANGPQEWVAFYQPKTNLRIVGMWARFGEAQTAVIAATNPAGTALLLHADGTQEMVTAVNGVYTIPLPGATNLNAPWDPTLYAIGGRTVILIEPNS